MRRFLGSVFGIFLLFGCSDLTDSPMGSDPGNFGTPGLSTASEVFDGSTEGNPHFFFLSPLVEDPVYSGVPDISLKPVVTVCNITDMPWDPRATECPETNIVAVFSLDAADPDDQLSVSDEAYSVVWKTDRYPAPEGETFRIAVSILDRTLGWLDATSYPPSVFASFKGTDPDGNVAISSNGSANIKFRIEDGALEAAFCDRDGIEDCDVIILDGETEGTLRVFENPEATGSPLGSEIRVPKGALLEGNPVQGPYAVILQLELPGVTQPYDLIPPDQQIPYFVDLRTQPPGITFPRPPEQGGPGGTGSEGVRILLCQVVDPFAPGYVDKELHPFLVPFVTRTGPSGVSRTTLLPVLPPDPDAEDSCDVMFGPHSHASLRSSGESGLRSRFSAGLSRISGFILPRPLMARRLHGGLNTVVWEISANGDDRDGGDVDNGGGDDPILVSGLTLSTNGTGEQVLEFGAVLGVDADLSNATVSFHPNPTLVDTETEIRVQILNAAGEPFPFQVDVTVDVTGANTESLEAEHQGNSLYRAAYTPAKAGTDVIVVTASRNGILEPTEIGTFELEVLPLSGDLVVVVEIEGSAPADGLPVYLYQGSGPDPFLTSTTGPDGAATFVDIDFGDYTVHLPKRDFDVQFATMTKSITHDQAPNTVTFTGVTQAIPPAARVFRVREVDGTGNAYRYMVGGRSWVASNNQVQNDVLLGVQGHLATIHTEGENQFIADLVRDFCPNVHRSSGECRSQAWIGLRFNSTAGAWQWVTGEDLTYTNWEENFPSSRNNHDHVEIYVSGFWRNINGANSTNDGYMAEWPVTWPATPPPLGGGE
jgi:hypothetical protein